MADTTKIEWTDATFNPWVGCSKISLACANCYAEGWAKRAGNPELWQGERRRTSAANWRMPVKLNAKAMAMAEGRRIRVFCASLADVFDNQVPTEWRTDLWALIRATPSLDWQLLTKRPQNIAKMLPPDWGNGWPNVWLGTTTENREEMLRRGAALKAIPATVRFWSAEPLLGDLGEIPAELMPDWVIAGGESGPGARPMHPDWARSLRDQCAAAGVAFHFKQWGEHVLCVTDAPGDGQGVVVYPDDAVGDVGIARAAVVEVDGQEYWRVGKARAGRLLDGRTHDEFPAADQCEAR